MRFIYVFIIVCAALPFAAGAGAAAPLELARCFAWAHLSRLPSAGRELRQAEATATATATATTSSEPADIIDLLPEFTGGCWSTGGAGHRRPSPTSAVPLCADAGSGVEGSDGQALDLASLLTSLGGWLTPTAPEYVPTTTTAPAAPADTSGALPSSPVPAAAPLATTPAASQPAAPAASSTSTDGGACPDASAALQAHNDARSRHGAAPLSWSASLASYAQSWSDHCVFQHSNGPYGENLAMGVSTCAAAVALWMDEEASWSPGMGFTEATGHFTQVRLCAGLYCQTPGLTPLPRPPNQVVWRSTTEVGCGLASCGGSPIVTCSYTPPGNVIGAFDQNVS